MASNNNRNTTKYILQDIPSNWCKLITPKFFVTHFVRRNFFSASYNCIRRMTIVSVLYFGRISHNCTLRVYLCTYLLFLFNFNNSFLFLIFRYETIIKYMSKVVYCWEKGPSFRTSISLSCFNRRICLFSIIYTNNNNNRTVHTKWTNFTSVFAFVNKLINKVILWGQNGSFQTHRLHMLLRKLNGRSGHQHYLLFSLRVLSQLKLADLKAK